MDDVLDCLKFVLFLVLAVALMFGILGGITYPIVKISCNSYTAMNPEYHFMFDFWAGGCFINYQGLWVSTDNIQFINGTITTK